MARVPLALASLAYRVITSVISSEEPETKSLKTTYFSDEIDGYPRRWWIKDGGLSKPGFWRIDAVSNKPQSLLGGLAASAANSMLFFTCVDLNTDLQWYLCLPFQPMIRLKGENILNL